MNILISATEDYLQYAEIMLFSLHLHTKEIVEVYLFHHGIDQRKLALFEKALRKKCKMTLHPIRLDSELFDGLPLGNEHFSKPEMFDRMMAQYYLPESVDRILWLDVDIIILNEISGFYSIPFSNDQKYVVCSDANDGMPVVQECKAKIGLPLDEKYFNSGVLLMNLSALRKGPNASDFLQSCLKYANVLTFPDQDLLNVFYHDSVIWADGNKYNYQLGGRAYCSDVEMENVAILHYTGAAKPWKEESLCPSSRFYWNAVFKYGKRWKAVWVYLKKIAYYVFVESVKNIKHLLWG